MHKNRRSAFADWYEYRRWVIRIAEFAQSYSHGEYAWPDLTERTGFWDTLFRERVAVEDDSMP